MNSFSAQRVFSTEILIECQNALKHGTNREMIFTYIQCRHFYEQKLRMMALLPGSNKFAPGMKLR